MKYDYLVFIGRFQPFHYGHAKVIQTALEQARHVIVLVGSATSPRSWRNPFTFAERAAIIESWYKEEVNLDTSRLILCPLSDYTYNDTAWIKAVQTTVDDAVYDHSGPGDHKIGLIGHSKDHSSYYLSLFPQWGAVDVPAFTERHLFNATEVRHAFFDDEPDPAHVDELWNGMPAAVTRFLMGFRDTDPYHHLKGEHDYVVTYRRDHSYANAAIDYRATHTTVDAVVVQAGHVLLIERDTHPGKGLTALPGGFINEDETLRTGMLRELREETKLRVPPPVVAGNIVHQEVFDEPNRSSRGRIFSHTFLISLPPQKDGLPKVRGGSDAKRAWWQPLSSLREQDFFEDHYHIIRHMTSRL